MNQTSAFSLVRSVSSSAFAECVGNPPPFLCLPLLSNFREFSEQLSTDLDLRSDLGGRTYLLVKAFATLGPSLQTSISLKQFDWEFADRQGKFDLILIHDSKRCCFSLLFSPITLVRARKLPTLFRIVWLVSNLFSRPPETGWLFCAFSLTTVS